jgi:hypothetical protein
MVPINVILFQNSMSNPYPIRYHQNEEKERKDELDLNHWGCEYGSFILFFN